MKCDNCGKREATVRYSENINGRKRELHLCEECSRELGIDRMDFNMPIDFSSFVSGMLEDFQSMDDFMPMLGTMTDEKCPSCGSTFQDIINTGKFGCANCYDTFESRLEPIMRKLQGADHHVGRLGKVTEHKIKGATEGKTVDTSKPIKKENSEVDKLKRELKKAVKEERYEDAAELRDKINKLEK